MARTFIVISVAVSLMVMFAVEVAGQEKRGKSQASEEAAKWVAAAGDRFMLEIYAGNTRLVFTPDKTAGPGQTTARFFYITREQAAGIAQALVDCGMWTRPDTLPEIQFNRILAVNTLNGRQQRAWQLGSLADDVSPMIIVQYLLKTLKGDAQQALKDWLALAQGAGKK